MMKVTQMEVAEAAHEARQPKAPTALYRHYNKRGTLLYVGISMNALSRQINHKNVSEWFDKVTRIEIERFPSRPIAERAEKEAIRNENPRHNIIHKVSKIY